MAALVTVVSTTTTGDRVFAIVADERGARYIWNDNVEPWWPDDKKRITGIVEKLQAKPETPRDWLELAMYSLGEIQYTTPREVANIDDAIDVADDLLDEETGSTPGNTQLGNVTSAYDEVTTDWPLFGEDDDVDADAMTTFVLSALGPIDPEGPNGWILRAMDGKPQPGDEKMFVTFTTDGSEENA